MPDDYSADRFTTGTVAVGDTATGNIGSNGDRDWFAVELVAGRTYVIDLRGSPTGDGTLSDPYLRGIHDSEGNLIPRTTNDDGGEGYNSRVTFTATESGTHYIAAGAAGVYFGRGTYEVEVTDTSPPVVAPDPDPEDPPDTQEQVQQQPPAFGSQFYGFELPEDTDGRANRISLGTVSATDPDGGSVTYSIEGGNAAGLFEIDAASGELFYTGGGEDYETGSTSFELTVRASDGDQTTDTTATVSVTDVDEPVEGNPPVAEPDPARAAAEDLGDITELAAPLFPLGTLDGAADGVAWYRFTLSEAREVALGLRRQDADADLVVEDAAGNVLHSGANDGTANEWVRETLLAGTYYVRVEAQEAGANAYVLTGPLFMLQVYDRVLTSRSEATLVALVLIVAFLFLMMGLLDHFRARVLARAGACFQARLDPVCWARSCRGPGARRRPARRQRPGLRISRRCSVSPRARGRSPSSMRRGRRSSVRAVRLPLAARCVGGLLRRAAGAAGTHEFGANGAAPGRGRARHRRARSTSSSRCARVARRCAASACAPR